MFSRWWRELTASAAPADAPAAGPGGPPAVAKPATAAEPPPEPRPAAPRLEFPATLVVAANTRAAVAHGEWCQDLLAGKLFLDVEVTRRYGTGLGLELALGPLPGSSGVRFLQVMGFSKGSPLASEPCPAVMIGDVVTVVGTQTAVGDALGEAIAVLCQVPYGSQVSLRVCRGYVHQPGDSWRTDPAWKAICPDWVG